MRLSDFRYDLPKELIAQEALPKRTEARLLVLDRRQGALAHRTFRDILEYLGAGDLVILNDTQVLPARLFARRKTGGRVEILVLGCRGASLLAPDAIGSLSNGQAQGPAPT